MKISSSNSPRETFPMNQTNSNRENLQNLMKITAGVSTLVIGYMIYPDDPKSNFKTARVLSAATCFCSAPYLILNGIMDIYKTCTAQ